MKLVINKNNDTNKSAVKPVLKEKPGKREQVKIDLPKVSKISQLRQELVTGDWVVIAAGRGKRPDDFRFKEQSAEERHDDCLFCDPEASGQEKDVLIYNLSDGDWSLRVFPNKYPAFSKPTGGKISHQEEGPYFWMEGIGYHEVIVTKDHKKHVGTMDPLAVAELFDAFQTRYLELMNKKTVRFIEIFHNHKKDAGASIAHPHSQLAAIPVISPYINLELNGSENYYHNNKKCVYCDMIGWEESHRKRVVFENDDFIAFCPFASRAAFEVWILPKEHKPYFERISDEEKVLAGQALHEVIRKISEALGDPAYNFYLHTSPCDGKDYAHYHWHIEVLPKTSVWAGFELSTGIEISTIEPEIAAEYLREI